MSLSPTSFKTSQAQITISYKLFSDKKKVLRVKKEIVQPGLPFVNAHLQVTAKAVRHKDEKGGYVLSISIEALQDMELVSFEATYIADLKDQRMMANGFQSWSQAREFTKNDKIPAIRSGIAWYTQLNLQGDYDIFQHSGEKGLIHSSSYTHFRDTKNVISFFGSVSESLGYTYFKGDFNNNNLGIYKDVLGKQLTSRQPVNLIQVFIAQGQDAEAAIWDTYAEFYEDRRAHNTLRHVNGWTSWYNYYGDVSEAIINENVEALQKYHYPINIFQIDDGFQTAIGDWLSINNKFPNGMKVVAEKIKSAGFKPGLWLAPYAVGFNSRIVKDHPEWLIKGEDGKFVVAGPNWGGFYALDMYNAQARQYLKNVFDVVLNDWGFDMLKLDFCFAAAMIPRLGKSRGEIMWEAMDLIRDMVGPEKLVLGCGVPLASAFRKVDFCRIGSDVAPWWEDSKLKMLHVRERVSTANSLVSTLTRWSMSDRMFGNDPDVMILRNKKNKLSPDERYTLCVLNNVLGALVFSSDNVALYGPDEHLLYAATFPKVVSRVHSVIEVSRNLFVVEFNVGTRRYTTYANLSDEEQNIYLPESNTKDTHLLFATDNDMHMTSADPEEHLFYHPQSVAKLKVHETKTFMHIPPLEESVQLLGSTSHIVPGAEIEDITKSESNEVKVVFRPENGRHRKVWLAMGRYLYEKRPTQVPEYKINGKPAAVEWIPVHGEGEGRPKSEVLAYVVKENYDGSIVI